MENRRRSSPPIAGNGLWSPPATIASRRFRLIEAYRVPTLDFSGGHTRRCYTRAKVIDMALSTEGEKLEQADELAKLARFRWSSPQVLVWRCNL
jgi:hypothetical protein